MAILLHEDVQSKDEERQKSLIFDVQLFVGLVNILNIGELLITGALRLKDFYQDKQKWPLMLP